MASNVAVIIAGSTTPVITAYYDLVLICTYDYHDYDGDLEFGSIIRWSRNNTTVTEFDGYRVLPFFATSIGESWTVSIIPSDGIEYGDLVSSTNSVRIVDRDSDNDGHIDSLDAFPYNSTEWSDSDGDGVGDNSDHFPHDPSEFRDSDGDGLGDIADTDDDNDGIEDDEDDSDGDGVTDSIDVFPENPDEWSDTDMDGVGDNSDAFPTDRNESTDSDGDGVGDNSDDFPMDIGEFSDSDGDGVGDNSDYDPNDPLISIEGDLGREDGISEALSLENIPPRVVETALAEVQDGVITQVELGYEDDVLIYELLVVRDGAEFELEISADGSLIEMEYEEDEDYPIAGDEVGNGHSRVVSIIVAIVILVVLGKSLSGTWGD
ncbi:MAG: hypothetical protein CMB75_04900 [Euryarchaeota archaeon]|nr:hypothetical protein [Euryarchaeota archaeon]